MSIALDLVLGLVLLGYLVQGWRLGFVRSIGAIAGIIAGGIAAALLSPLIGSLVPDETGKVVATIVAAVVLVLLGHAIGSGIGAAIGGVLRRSPLGPIDRILGAAAQLVVSALAISMIASLAVSLGVPYVAQPVAGSVVLRAIDGVTPAPLDRALAQLRSTVLSSGIPRLGISLGTEGVGAEAVPGVPQTAGLRTAVESVVKITGRAPACNQEQSGSGFVVARNRVLTNAHVVSGVAAPVVLAPNGQALQGRVTAFDPQRDLAIIAVPGLDARPLAVAPSPAVGDEGVVAGYPFGGPFTEGGAKVVQVGQVVVPDAVGGGRTARSIAALAADVEQGNSGGPLLSPGGRVIGLVFAKSTSTADLGYAMTPDEFGDLADRAPSLTAAVSTGACSRD
ncbi:MarP family serine protease [uncultured Amnibacterium sp.]|uniref:MarP family serine protease n=1 Tax=uncultured Amnibacterium sp. TaxID=1631851 RepID=UPI0035CAC4D3